MSHSTDDALFASLLGGGPVIPLSAEESRDLLDDTSDELADVSRRISGQYAEVMARFAARAFSGSVKPADVQQVRASISALRRLASVTGVTRQVELLDELDGVASELMSAGARGRQAALRQLRDWIPSFAETLGPEDAERLVRLVEWEKGDAPLLDELSSLRGIGPRRLQRLYAAGLFTVEAVANANPEDITAVTGIPLALSRDVVEATRTYARDERTRCVRALREHAARLDRLQRSTVLPPHQRVRIDVLEALTRATQLIEDLAKEIDP